MQSIYDTDKQPLQEQEEHRICSNRDVPLLSPLMYFPCPVSNFLTFFSLRHKGPAQHPLQSPTSASSQQFLCVLWTQRSPFFV